MTKIAWTDETWNPVAGCTKVSAGCLNCYAERMAKRLNAMYAARGDEDNHAKITDILKWDFSEPDKYKFGRAIGWNGEVALYPDRLDIPLHWRNPRRIFVNSMSDTFHSKVPFEFIDKMFAVMALCPQHTFQVLTKRPERMLEYLVEHFSIHDIKLFLPWAMDTFKRWSGIEWGWPFPNIHIGTTCENQETADKRIPTLLQIPAAVRFISAEPLLGELALDRCLGVCKHWNAADGRNKAPWHPEDITKIRYAKQGLVSQNYKTIDQVIIGAESLGGHPGRECKIEWVRNIVRQCKAAGVAVFVKQIHMWRTKLPESLLKNAPIVPAYFETEAEALEWAYRDKPKRVLLKYPRDKDLFPTDLQCWEYPG